MIWREVVNSGPSRRSSWTWMLWLSGRMPTTSELACGGTLIKLAALGHKTGVIALTRGEMGTRGSAEIRAREFDAAAEIMGLAVHRMLDIPDGRVEVTWRTSSRSSPRSCAPTGRRSSSPPIGSTAIRTTNRHPSSCARRPTSPAWKRSRRGRSRSGRIKVVFYQSRFEFAPSFIVDISDAHERKMKAVRAYESQFHRAGPGRTRRATATLIGRPEFLDSIEARDRQYGAPDRREIRRAVSRPGSHQGR